MEAQKDGRWSIPVFQIDSTFDVDQLPYPFRAAKPLNPSFEIASNDVAKMVSGKVVVLALALAGKTETQIDENDMFSGAWKCI